MKIEFLKWDSDFFGLKIGKLDVTNLKDFNPIEFRSQAKSENFELIYVFSFNELMNIDLILQSGIELVDVLLSMSKKFNKTEYLNLPYSLRTDLSNKELIEGFEIAESIAKVSRFYKEKKIGSDKSKKFYRRWLENAINRSFADGVFLSKLDLRVCGIHVVRTDDINQIGYCSIIGIHPDYKVRGIGKQLWEQAFRYWANEKEIEKCVVPFSLQNIESFNFHLKLGFNKIEEIKYIYHYRCS